MLAKRVPTILPNLTFEEALEITKVHSISEELKENLIGNVRGANGATIARACEKIINDRIDVMVENDGFDLFLANSYALHG